MALPAGRNGLARVDFGLLVTILVWGVNYAVIKAALAELQPLVFNAIRFSLATLTIALLVRGRGPAPASPARTWCGWRSSACSATPSTR